MLICTFEDGKQGAMRHVVTDNVVLQGDQILLVKRAAHLLEGGKWALPGGYADRDETMKESAMREILEETGYEVTGVTLLRIIDRPDRPREDRQNISFVHFCTATKKVGEPDNESTEQRWFSLSDLPPQDKIAFDHAESIEVYKKYLQQPFQLPRL